MADTDLNEAGLGSMQPSLHPPRSAVDSEFRCSDLVALLRIIAQILLCVQRIKAICNTNTKRGAPQMLETKSTNVDSFLWQASPGECVGTIGSSPGEVCTGSDLVIDLIFASPQEPEIGTSPKTT